MASSSRGPCAACKHLRRKCVPECTFRPYFPQHRLAKFVDVHRAFGASNAARLLSDVALPLRGVAVESLSFEAEIHLMDEIGGCLGLIERLSARYNDMRKRLEAVDAEIFLRDGDSAAYLLNESQLLPASAFDITGAAGAPPQDVRFNPNVDGMAYDSAEPVSQIEVVDAAEMFSRANVLDQSQPPRDGIAYDNPQMDGTAYNGTVGPFQQDLPPLQQDDIQEMMRDLFPLLQDHSQEVTPDLLLLQQEEQAIFADE